MEDSSLAVARAASDETEVAVRPEDIEVVDNGQVTPASKLRRFSGILDSAVRTFLSGCRSPLNAATLTQSTPGGSGDQGQVVDGEGTSEGALFSPGAGRKDSSGGRKRRIPLSSMNNVQVVGGVGRAGEGEAGEGGEGNHATAVASATSSAVKMNSPAAYDLITSSQRKKSKKKRLNAGGAGESENVLPRNLNKVFMDEEAGGQSEVHDDRNGTLPGVEEEDGGAAEANDEKGEGKRGGGVLSNLLFSPMFTLLGRGKQAQEGDQERYAEDQAAANLNCEEGSLEAAVESSDEEDSVDLVPIRDESDEDDSEVDYDYSQSFDPFYFIKNLPPLELCVPAYRENLLPRQTRQQRNKKTLVLDLDETLVHSSLENELPCDGMEEQLKYDFTFPVHLGDERYDVYVYVRPGALEFLEKMQELYEVVIFTASQKMYAEKLLNILDPQRRFIRHRLFRDSCVLVEGNYLKDLSIIGRDLKDTIIVDNSPQAFAFQLSNGIPIESWFDDQQDRELLKLIPFLKKLTKVEDVRPSIVKRYKLHDKVAKAC
ncbi:Dullard-like phosphatase [Chloropicon primus]|nr:Dullard-like phosphatase [Chloropicon primus]